jgi:HEAT repeat protein
MLTVLLIASLVFGGNALAADPSPEARQAAWTVLDQSLHDDSADRRRYALAALATIGGPDEDAVKRGEEALKDKDTLVRQSAALCLGQLHSSAAIPALQNALEDTGEVAFAAAKSLIDLGDHSGEGMLIAVLTGDRKDTPGIMTNAMREAKQKLKHPEGLFLMGAEDATGAMFGPAAMGITAVKDTASLHSKGTPGRAAAAAYLARDPDPYAITLIEWALTDDNQFVRMEAARALGQRGNSESIPKLQAALNDAHTAVRDMAGAAIIRISDRNGEAGMPAQETPITSIAPQKKK